MRSSAWSPPKDAAFLSAVRLERARQTSLPLSSRGRLRRPYDALRGRHAGDGRGPRYLAIAPSVETESALQPQVLLATSRRRSENRRAWAKGLSSGRTELVGFTADSQHSEGTLAVRSMAFPRYEVRREELLRGELRHDGYAFYFKHSNYEDAGTEAVALLGYGEIAVEVYLPSGRVGGIEGYVPTSWWKAAHVELPPARQAAVYVVNVEDLPLSPHTVWSLTEQHLTGLKFDPSTGWCHIGSPPDEESAVIEVTSGIRYVLRIDAIIGAYVRPANIDEICSP